MKRKSVLPMPGRRAVPARRVPAAFAALAGALAAPGRAFAGAEADAVPRAVVLLLLFSLVVAGGRLASTVTLTPEATALAMNEVDARIGSLMGAAPPEARDEARRAMLDSLVGRSSGITAAFSIVAAGVGFLLVLGELWLASLVVTQFFGGDEERRGGRRASVTLVLCAGVPLAARRFLAGLLAAVRGPQAALNSLTLEEYRSRSVVRLDLASLAGIDRLPPILTAAARLLTDPFVVWALAILVLGGRSVYRLSLRAAAGQVGVLVALLVLQSWLLGRLGIPWEL
jgi:hypothetical protein